MILAKLAPVFFIFVLLGQVKSDDEDSSSSSSDSEGSSSSSSSSSSEESSNCVMYPIKIYVCKDTWSETDFKVTTKDTDHPNAKIYTFVVDLSEDISSSTVYEIVVDRWVDGYWKNFHNQAGPYCENQQQMFRKASEKLRAMIEPPIETECDIMGGHYELKDFELDSGDFDIPFGQEDSFRASMKLVTENKVEIACAVVELNITCPK